MNPSPCKLCGNTPLIEVGAVVCSCVTIERATTNMAVDAWNKLMGEDQTDEIDELNAEIDRLNDTIETLEQTPDREDQVARMMFKLGDLRGELDTLSKDQIDDRLAEIEGVEP